MIDEQKEIESLKKYWIEFYALYDTLPVDLKIKLMDQEKMPVKPDITRLLEEQEIDNFFEGFQS